MRFYRPNRQRRDVWRLIKTSSLFLFIILGLNACSHSDDTPDIATCSTQRTVLVYIMGNNSLSYTANPTKDINEMMDGMTELNTDSCNLLVYADSMTTNTPKLIKLNRVNGKVVQTVIQTYSKQIATDETIMESVFSTVFSKYPSKSYGLVLWSHGWGWLPKVSSTSNTASRHAGQDKSNGTHYLNISNLSNVLAATNIHFDFILFDECFMSSIEALYDLRNYADYFIGSATEIPGPGAYYKDLVPAMFALPTSSTSSYYAEKIADGYYNYYKNKYDISQRTSFSNENWIAGASISLIKSSELSELAAATKSVISKYIKNQADIDCTNIFCYDKLSDNYMYDLENLIKQITGGNADYTAWKTVYDKCIIKYQTTATNFMSNEYGYDFISMTGSTGVSAYIPKKDVSMNTSFAQTKWYTDAGWDQTGW